MIKNKVVLQVLAGGEGLRIKKYINNKTKQFQDLLNINESMLSYTLRLYKNSKIFNDSIVVTVNKYKNEIKKHISKKQNVLYEPQGKGTAYQIICSLSQLNLNDIVLFTPSDHYFKYPDNLYKQLNQQITLQERNEEIILLGDKIDKNNINTQYGWLEQNYNLDNKDLIIGEVKRFIEKPSIEKQEQMINSDKEYFYNMGIFIGKVKIFYDLISKQNYSLYKTLLKFRYDVINIKNEYQKLEKKSFDKEVMEKANKLLFISTDYGWNDIGLIDNLKKVKEEIA